MNLQVNKRAVAGFKRRATSAYPNEHLELLFGTMTADTIRVLAIIPVEITVASTELIRYSGCDAERVRSEMARAHGYMWLGTIHSHPEQASPDVSLNDAVGAKADHEPIFGILAILQRPQRKRYKLSWWLPTALVTPSYL